MKVLHDWKVVMSVQEELKGRIQVHLLGRFRGLSLCTESCQRVEGALMK